MKDSIELRDRGCQYCNTEPNCPPMPKQSYDDYDGMIACVHDSEPNEHGHKSLAWWLTVNFRGEQRDFYIEFCPFCGRRLVPFREEDYIGQCCG